MKTASEEKFGKTEAGTIWLDSQRTSPFRFYQFWLNTDDRDVAAYLKFFTFLDQLAVAELEEAVRTVPERRDAQRALAREVTTIVHGAEHNARAERVELLFGSASPT
jgi:tyrosyl-tRNA synthetase